MVAIFAHLILHLVYVIQQFFMFMVDLVFKFVSTRKLQKTVITLIFQHCELINLFPIYLQLISNSYRMAHNAKFHLWASLGYVVVIIDGAGSWRRGLRYEGYIRENMGTVEVQDQVDGLQCLIEQGFVDPNRIAVTGWSYG
jgi:hypothetical protein